MFTDETRASLDGPDNWQKCWVLLNEQRPVKYIRQKQGGSIMIWAGIIDNKIIGPFRVPDGVKLTSNTYIEFLRENFLPFFNSIPKEKKRKFVLMQDNAPSHAAKKTKVFLINLGINLMSWPPNSPDLNPIENLWSLLKSHLYKNGKKYRNKNELWEEIQRFCEKIDGNIIKNLTESVNRRLFQLVLNKGGYVNY